MHVCMYVYTDIHYTTTFSTVVALGEQRLLDQEEKQQAVWSLHGRRGYRGRGPRAFPEPRYLEDFEGTWSGYLLKGSLKG